MITIKNYVKAASLEEAWELNQKRTAQVIGGMLWVRMGNKNIQTVIDLSELGLDQIEETDDEYRIGCMVTLRQLEMSASLETYTDGAMKEALKHIVGVQFRNLATVGGSIYGRFGFSDVLTIFLAMDSYVELYKGGIVSMQEFAQMPYDNDILVRIIIKKSKEKLAYQSVRPAKTDFPTLTCAISRDISGDEEAYRIAVGARPSKAMIVVDEKGILKEGLSEKSIRQFAEYAAEQVPTESNMRGSAKYRTHLVKVLVMRVLESLKGEEKC